MTAAVYRAVRFLADAASWIAAASVLGSLFLVVYSVGMRYLANRPEPWVDELVGYVLVASVAFAIAEALSKGEHICVDILTERLGAPGQRAVHVVGLLAVALTAVILIVEGWEMVAFSRLVGIRSIGYLSIEIWIPQLMVPLGGVLLLLTALAELLRVAARLPSPGERERPDSHSPEIKRGALD